MTTTLPRQAALLPVGRCASLVPMCGSHSRWTLPLRLQCSTLPTSSPSLSRHSARRTASYRSTFRLLVAAVISLTCQPIGPTPPGNPVRSLPIAKWTVVKRMLIYLLGSLTARLGQPFIQTVPVRPSLVLLRPKCNAVTSIFIIKVAMLPLIMISLKTAMLLKMAILKKIAALSSIRRARTPIL